MSGQTREPDSESIRREYPQGPITSAHAIIFYEGRVLLVHRANAPSKGRWSIPGGMVELGETVADAVRREICEECGIEIEIERIVDIANHIVLDEEEQVRFHYILIYLLGHYVSGKIRSASDALGVDWVKCEELDTLDMHPRARKAVLQAMPRMRADCARRLQKNSIS
jgi:8-oxo-dGTP diphosphatase